MKEAILEELAKSPTTIEIVMGILFPVVAMAYTLSNLPSSITSQFGLPSANQKPLNTDLERQLNHYQSPVQDPSSYDRRYGSSRRVFAS